MSINTWSTRVVKCGSKNGHQKYMCLKRADYTCAQTSLLVPSFNDQHNLGIYMSHWRGKRTFTQIVYKIFIWIPKAAMKIGMHLVPIACVISKESGCRLNSNLWRLIYLRGTKVWFFQLIKMKRISFPHQISKLVF